MDGGTRAILIQWFFGKKNQDLDYFGCFLMIFDIFGYPTIRPKDGFRDFCGFTGFFCVSDLPVTDMDE